MWPFIQTAESKRNKSIRDFFKLLNQGKFQKEESNSMLTIQQKQEIHFIHTYLTKGNKFHLLDPLIQKFLKTNIISTAQLLNSQSQHLIHNLLLENLNYSLYVKFECIRANDTTREMFYSITREWIESSSEQVPFFCAFFSCCVFLLL
jgi:hypothetical protein